MLGANAFSVIGYLFERSLRWRCNDKSLSGAIAISRKAFEKIYYFADKLCIFSVSS